MFSEWKKLVESRVFVTPKPLFGGALEDADCRRVHAACGVPSICVRHSAPKRTAVFFHGNSGNLNDPRVVDFARKLSESASADVYVPEYPGYAEGTEASEEALAQAGVRFLEALKPDGSIVLVGYSLGSFPALKAAHLAHAVVLVAPLYSALACVLAATPTILSYAWVWRFIDSFCNTPVAHGKPQLVVAAGLDDVTPPFHGRPLGGQFTEVPHATHSTVSTDPGTFDAIRVFVESV